MISRQRQWQIKRREQGLCIICGDAGQPTTRKDVPSGISRYCKQCTIKNRERQRVRKGMTRRLLNAKSYQEEK